MRVSLDSHQSRLAQHVDSYFSGCRLIGRVPYPPLGEDSEAFVFDLGQDHPQHIGILYPDGAAIVSPRVTFMAGSGRVMRKGGRASERELQSLKDRLLAAANSARAVTACVLAPPQQGLQQWQLDAMTMVMRAGKGRRRVRIKVNGASNGVSQETKTSKGQGTKDHISRVRRQRVRASLP